MGEQRAIFYILFKESPHLIREAVEAIADIASEDTEIGDHLLQLLEESEIEEEPNLN